MEGHSIAELARAIHNGESTAVRTVDDCLKRIGSLDPTINAFIQCDHDKARQKAGEIDARIGRGEYPGALAGVPVAVKDNICTTDSPTTCGSRILQPFESRYDAHVVQRLESAGAIIIGKTNLDEFAMGSSTENSAFGPTLNPWDPERVAGGSSGGPVAAVASRMVPAALGSDTGGSVRQPASFCGVVGLKPSYGRVSRFGLVAFGSSLDQIGPIGHTVQDVALLLSVIAGHDPNDSTSVNAPVPDYLSCLDAPLAGVRVGVCEAYFGDGLDADVEAAVRAALALMESNGATLVDIDLPHMRFATACYYLIAPAEASSNLARFDGVHYGHRSHAPRDVLQLYTTSRGEGFGEEVKRRIMLGTYALSAGYHDEYYLKALRVRTLIKRDFDDAFGKVDVIASPVATTPAFRLGERCDDPLAMYLSDVYTIAANLAGICAISVPCGFSGGALPIGLQLMGPSFGEEKLLQVAGGFQALTNYHLQTPPAISGKS